ncbi:MAG: crossover junction endodeoxyribonuclease RuvC, partial [Actinomycetota bacterium]
MRVMGVDPGLTRAGFAVVEQIGGKLKALEFGTIRPEGDDVPAQLADLRARLAGALGRHAPDAMAVERLFVTRNQRTAIRVGQASAMALLVAA